MESRKSLISRRTILLLVAALLINMIALMGAIGVTQAAPSEQSDFYETSMKQSHLAVALTEKTGTDGQMKVVNVGDATNLLLDNDKIDVTIENEGKLLTDTQALLGDDESLVPGKTYAEEISVKNVSTQSEYVRLAISKYWMGEGFDLTNPGIIKRYDLNPSVIDLILPKDEGDARWVISEEESTDETTVFYYTKKLEPGEVANAAIVGIRLDENLADADERKAAMGYISYEVNGETYWIVPDPLPTDFQIGISAEVDSVQTFDAPTAAKSAWGVDIASILGENAWNER